MQDNIILLVFSVITAWCGIIIIKPIAAKVGLVDKPNNRKQHVGAIPLVGGIAIFISVFLSIAIFYPAERTLMSYLMCAAIIVVLGVVDDYRDISAKFRLLAQTLIALAMIAGIELYISDLGDLFSTGDIDLRGWGVPFTVVAVIAAINAYNMIDGIDGLAGSLSIVTFISLALLFAFNGHAKHALLPLILVAALLPYMAFNLGMAEKPNRKIFMGDAGTMFVGLSVVWLLIIGTQGDAKSFQPITALWIIGVPLMDMAAIMLRRIKKGQSPLKADRDHLHHIFMRLGLSSRQALCLISTIAINLAIIGISIEVYGGSELFSLLLFVIVFITYTAGLNHIWRIIRFVKKHRIAHLRKTRR